MTDKDLARVRMLRACLKLKLDPVLQPEVEWAFGALLDEIYHLRATAQRALRSALDTAPADKETT